MKNEWMVVVNGENMKGDEGEYEYGVREGGREVQK